MCRRDSDGRSIAIEAVLYCPSSVGLSLRTSWETHVAPNSKGGNPSASEKMIIIALTAMIAPVHKVNSPAIPARTADIPLAPAILAVTDVLAPAPSAKSQTALARTAEAALVSNMNGCISVQGPAATRRSPPSRGDSRAGRWSCGTEATGDDRPLPELGFSDTRERYFALRADGYGRSAPMLDDPGGDAVLQLKD